MIQPEQLRTGILIGGSGRRMGGPKQMVQVADRYLIDFVIDALAGLGHLALLGAGPIPEHLQDVDRVPDVDGSVGPLAGVLGALASDSSSAWLIVACDQPWLTAAAIDWLLTQRTPDGAAVMPRDSSRVQPFPGIYQPGFADLVEQYDNGVAISHLVDHARVVSPLIPTALTQAWGSVNRPEDLQPFWSFGRVS